MDPQFWHERWRQNQIGFHQPGVNDHLQRFYRELDLAPGAGVFVPLAGKSLDMVWLRSQGHPVIGVELSSIAVQAFFAENGLSAQCRREGAFEVCEAEGVRLLCGDFFDLSPAELTGVSAAYDRAALIALPADMRARYVDQLVRVLPPDVSILLVTLEYPAGEMQGPPFSVDEAEVRALYAPRFEVRVLAAVDRLPAEPRFRDKGVHRLEEKVYLLRRSCG
jgi:thiopurine S-methyltransferase